MSSPSPPLIPPFLLELRSCGSLFFTLFFLFPPIYFPSPSFRTFVNSAIPLSSTIFPPLSLIVSSTQLFTMTTRKRKQDTEEELQALPSDESEEEEE